MMRKLGFCEGGRRRARGRLVVLAAVLCALGLPTVALGADESPSPGDQTIVLVVGRAEGVSTDDIGDALDEFDVESVESVPKLGATTVTLEASDAKEAMEQLGDRATFVEPSVTFRALDFQPSDPLFGVQYELPQVGFPGGWVRTTGAGQKIAVLDTGVNPNEDLVDASGASIVAGYDFIDDDADPADPSPPEAGAHEHGTLVATVAAGRANGVAAVGACPGCSVMPVRVLDEAGEGSDVSIAQGIEWATDHGADVINLSLGGPSSSTLVATAIENARAEDVVVVAAAGNLNDGESGEAAMVPFYPAAYPGVLAVAATCSPTAHALVSGPCEGIADGAVAPFSHRGEDWVDVAAPGVNIATGTAGAVYFRGTSSAAPLVSGAAALLRAAHPGWSEEQVRDALIDTASPIQPQGEVAGGEIRVAGAIVAEPAPGTSPGGPGGGGGGTFSSQSDLTPPGCRVLGEATTVSGITSTAVTATDDVKVASVTLEVSGRAVGTAWGPTNGVWMVPWDSREFSDGSTGLQAVVTDSSGNSTRTDGVYLTVDNHAPEIRLVGPAFGTRVRGPFGVLSLATDDGSGVKVTMFVAGSSWAGASQSSIAGAFIPTRRAGPLVVRAVAVDNAGHASISNPVVVIVKRGR